MWFLCHQRMKPLNFLKVCWATSGGWKCLILKEMKNFHETASCPAATPTTKLPLMVNCPIGTFLHMHDWFKSKYAELTFPHMARLMHFPSQLYRFLIIMSHCGAGFLRGWWWFRFEQCHLFSGFYHVKYLSNDRCLCTKALWTWNNFLLFSGAKLFP